MSDIKHQSTLAFFLLFLIVSSLIPLSSEAVVIVESAVASGNIVQKHEDAGITLENGTTYYPSREGLDVTVQVGQPVTFRYVVDVEGVNKFF